MSATELNEFMDVMSGYAPTIPEELIEYYLQQVGFTSRDPRIIRMIALVAHKFLLDVTHDAKQYQGIRANSSNISSSSSNVPRSVLSMEDLAASLKEYGVNLCKPEYCSDSANKENN